jgi:hypothetical protein
VVWPDTLARAKFAVQIGAAEVGLRPLGTPDGNLWKRLFTEATPVAGFQFKDMSEVNLRSFPVRNVLGFVKRHYGPAGDAVRVQPSVPAAVAAGAWRPEGHAGGAGHPHAQGQFRPPVD